MPMDQRRHIHRLWFLHARLRIRAARRCHCWLPPLRYLPWSSGICKVCTHLLSFSNFLFTNFIIKI
jgi:hypothetical protein